MADSSLPTPDDYENLLGDVADGKTDYGAIASSSDPTERQIADQLRVYAQVHHGFDLNNAIPVPPSHNNPSPQDTQKAINSFPGSATIHNYLTAIPGLQNIERMGIEAGPASVELSDLVTGKNTNYQPVPDQTQNVENALTSRNQAYKQANNIGLGITPAEVAGGLTLAGLTGPLMEAASGPAALSSTAGPASNLIKNLGSAAATGLGYGNIQNISSQTAETGKLPAYKGLASSALQNLLYAGTGVGGQLIGEGVGAVGRGIANNQGAKVGQILENVPKLQVLRNQLNSLVQGMKPPGVGTGAYDTLDYSGVGDLGPLPQVTAGEESSGLPLPVKDTLNAAASAAIGGKYGTTFPYLKSNPSDLIPSNQHPDILNKSAGDLENVISSASLDPNSPLSGDDLTELGKQAETLKVQAQQNAAALQNGQKNLGDHLLDQQAYVNGELRPVVPAGAVQATNNSLVDQLTKSMDQDTQGPKAQFTAQAQALQNWMKPVLEKYTPLNQAFGQNAILNNIQSNIPSNISTFDKPGVESLGPQFEQAIGIPAGSSPEQLAAAQKIRQGLGSQYEPISQTGQQYSNLADLTNQRLGVVNKAAMSPADAGTAEERARQGALAGVLGLHGGAAYKLAQAAGAALKPGVTPSQTEALSLLSQLGRQPTAEAANGYTMSSPIADALSKFQRYQQVRDQLNNLASRSIMPAATAAGVAGQNQ